MLGRQLDESRLVASQLHLMNGIGVPITRRGILDDDFEAGDQRRFREGELGDGS